MFPVIAHVVRNARRAFELGGEFLLVASCAQEYSQAVYHKTRNVLDELPKEQHGQALYLMRASWKVKPPRKAKSASNSAIPGKGSRIGGAQPEGKYEGNVHVAAAADSALAA